MKDTKPLNDLFRAIKQEGWTSQIDAINNAVFQIGDIFEKNELTVNESLSAIECVIWNLSNNKINILLMHKLLTEMFENINYNKNPKESNNEHT